MYVNQSISIGTIQTTKSIHFYIGTIRITMINVYMEVTMTGNKEDLTLKMEHKMNENILEVKAEEATEAGEAATLKSVTETPQPLIGAFERPRRKLQKRSAVITSGNMGNMVVAVITIIATTTVTMMVLVAAVTVVREVIRTMRITVTPTMTTTVMNLMNMRTKLGVGGLISTTKTKTSTTTQLRTRKSFGTRAANIIPQRMTQSNTGRRTRNMLIISTTRNTSATVSK